MFEKYALKWTPVWLAIGWLLIVSVIVLSLVRLGPATPGGQTDKVAHFLAYGTLMFWFAQIYSAARTRLAIAAGLALMGVGLEIAQSFTDYRTFEYADMAANTVGVIGGWLIAPPRIANMLLFIERWR